MKKPFSDFAETIRTQAPLRAAITAAYRRAEQTVSRACSTFAALPEKLAVQVSDTARSLVMALRAKAQAGGVEGLIHEYSLSSQEGVALMCLAEALLRIPDAATRDALIRDKIASGDWRAHVGHSPSLVRQCRHMGAGGHRKADRDDAARQALVPRSRV